MLPPPPAAASLAVALAVIASVFALTHPVGVALLAATVASALLLVAAQR